MSISPNRRGLTDARATGVVVGNEVFTVCLSDGRELSVPFRCYPRLERATPQQRAHFEVCAGGRMLRWPEIDEDLEVAHIVAGRMPVKQDATHVPAVVETGTRTRRVAESKTPYGI